MKQADGVLLRVLREPGVLESLSTPQWEWLLRQARHADLLARIAWWSERVMPAGTPPGVREHLADVTTLAKARQQEVLREVAALRRALEPLGLPLVLLKGAAYLATGEAAGAGRMFSDIDLLVPKPRLPEVEASLMQHGWAALPMSDYDQGYYRRWMHELPPMRHMHRQTVIDVHHAILPATARLRPSSDLILAAAVAVDGEPGLCVLAPVDRVLHGTVHLLHNEEMSHGLRDLSDLDLMLREHGTDDRFWAALVDRAQGLGLQRPLFYGLRYARLLLGTPVPPATVSALSAAAPPAILLRLMDALWCRALAPLHPGGAARGTTPALWALYIRAHWLRMPPFLLARHLAVKAVARWRAAYGPEHGEGGTAAPRR